MIIRSQDKKLLINCENLFVKEYKICYENSNGVYVLGQYKNEKQAMEVIDSIWFKLKSVKPNETFVFQMPTVQLMNSKSEQNN